MAKDAQFNREHSSLLKTLGIAVAILLVLLIGWHVLLFLLGVTFAVTMAGWGFISGLVSLMCVFTMLFFVFAGLWIVLSCVGAIVLVVVALCFLPFAFPVLVPVLVIMLFLAIMRSRKRV